MARLRPLLLRRLWPRKSTFKKLNPLPLDPSRIPLHTSSATPPVSALRLQVGGQFGKRYAPEMILAALPTLVTALNAHVKIPKSIMALQSRASFMINDVERQGDTSGTISNYKKVSHLAACTQATDLYRQSYLRLKCLKFDLASAKMGTKEAVKPQFLFNALQKTFGPVAREDFDPEKHINFEEPIHIYTMKDLNLPEGTGVSSFAVSEPFQLFTQEAVMRMRKEVLSDEVLKNCQYSSNLAQCQLRGYAAKYAPFVYDTWKHPETLAIVSKIAGIELMTEMDFEIGHVNISAPKSEEQRREELQAYADKTQAEEDEGIAGCPWEDDRPIVDWHTDSYPFVCVTMLSDCTNMVGGETALRTGTGDVLKVRGPQMGCAVVLQGRYIEHQALRAFGAAERITMVTSFRPKHHHYPDDTVLTTVRPVSNLSELYSQFTEYRLEILEERLRNQLRELRDSRRGGKKFATVKVKRFLREQELFLSHMNNELIEDEKVQRGNIDDSHLLNTPPMKRSRKRPRSD